MFFLENQCVLLFFRRSGWQGAHGLNPFSGLWDPRSERPEDDEIKIDQIWSKIVKIGPNWPKLVKIGQNLAKFGKICQSWQKILRLTKITKISQKLAQIRQNWPQLTKISQNRPILDLGDPKTHKTGSARVPCHPVPRKNRKKHWFYRKNEKNMTFLGFWQNGYTT